MAGVAARPDSGRLPLLPVAPPRTERARGAHRRAVARRRRALPGASRLRALAVRGRAASRHRARSCPHRRGAHRRRRPRRLRLARLPAGRGGLTGARTRLRAHPGQVSARGRQVRPANGRDSTDRANWGGEQAAPAPGSPRPLRRRPAVDERLPRTVARSGSRSGAEGRDHGARLGNLLQSRGGELPRLGPRPVLLLARAPGAPRRRLPAGARPLGGPSGRGGSAGSWRRSRVLALVSGEPRRAAERARRAPNRSAARRRVAAPRPDSPVAAPERSTARPTPSAWPTLFALLVRRFASPCAGRPDWAPWRRFSTSPRRRARLSDCSSMARASRRLPVGWRCPRSPGASLRARCRGASPRPTSARQRRTRPR